MRSLRLASFELGISQSTLKRWIYAGRIKAVKLGKKWFIDENELERARKEGVAL